MRPPAPRSLGWVAFLVATLLASACDDLDDVEVLLSVGDVEGDLDDGFDGGGIVVVVIDDEGDRDDDSGPDIVSHPGPRAARTSPRPSDSIGS